MTNFIEISKDRVNILVGGAHSKRLWDEYGDMLTRCRNVEIQVIFLEEPRISPNQRRMLFDCAPYLTLAFFDHDFWIEPLRTQCASEVNNGHSFLLMLAGDEPTDPSRLGHSDVSICNYDTAHINGLFTALNGLLGVVSKDQYQTNIQAADVQGLFQDCLRYHVIEEKAATHELLTATLLERLRTVNPNKLEIGGLFLQTSAPQYGKDLCRLSSGLREEIAVDAHYLFLLLPGDYEQSVANVLVGYRQAKNK